MTEKEKRKIRSRWYRAFRRHSLAAAEAQEQSKPPEQTEQRKDTGKDGGEDGEHRV